jgi:phosphoglycerol transferase MdoB-like AlkP superfamily enzyme
MLVGRDLHFGLHSWPALFWDDALVALIFAAFEWLTRKRPLFSTVCYVTIVAYVAINVPLARLTSSPLTLPMIRATGSALSDSIVYHLTVTNVFLIGLVVLVAIAFPLAPGVRQEMQRRFLVLPLAVLSLGIFIAPPTNGFERNAFTALARSFLPRVQARATNIDWRSSLVPSSMRDPSLDFLRGAAHGRNVVVIALESTAAQHLKVYGAKSDPMPNLTALADRAVLFENAYSVYPESIKGLFSVLCSRYPAFDTGAADYERVRTPALAQALRDGGYRTALFHSGRFMYLGMRSIIDHRGFETLEDAGHIGGNHNSSFGVDEPSTVRRILQWIDGLKSNERFFVMYLPIAGHHPYEVPVDGPFPGRDERTHYLNALHYGDSALGELLRGLKGRGRDTNTLFVIYGDHGEAFGEHAANFGHTFFLYEENVHVPLLLYAPGLITEPARINNIASLLDVTPTISDVIGLRPQPGWQGTSLLEGHPRVALFFTDYSLPLMGIRDGPNKIICEFGAHHAQFFGLASSRCETRNIASENSALLALYRTRLQSWAAEQKALLKP